MPGLPCTSRTRILSEVGNDRGELATSKISMPRKRLTVVNVTTASNV